MESTRCVNSIEDTPHPVMVTSHSRRKEKKKEKQQKPRTKADFYPQFSILRCHPPMVPRGPLPRNRQTEQGVCPFYSSTGNRSSKSSTLYKAR
ncbi:hypothetical protein CEXT_285751 [Caerostris extrusa]|uniref:Uncharacterized protein n=1 Tax=Caerostris extrusa TaxID=172846 RepID=A0AAV4V044_CAEEX|nr:hypothetical protein CEXT_285751 [Caerostris extrusa]